MRRVAGAFSLPEQYAREGARELLERGRGGVARHLVEGLRGAGLWSSWRTPATNSLFRARDRLGSEPLRVLFAATAQPLADGRTPGAFWMAALAECGTHVVLDVELGGCRVGELTLSARLVRFTGPDMLVVADHEFPRE